MANENIAFRRPTTPVRQRMYIFYRRIQNIVLKKSVTGGDTQIVRLLPQGNLADGNRVTHGWKIWINLINPGITDELIISLNGAVINFGFNYNSGPVLLLDTTLDPLGVDSTQYEIFVPGQVVHEKRVNIFVVEQLLQISPM